LKKTGYPVPDPNKTMINDTKEPSNAHKNTLKEEILQEITENFMEKILHMVNQNVQDALKKFQDTKNKEYEKTQKQINELRGAIKKHQRYGKPQKKRIKQKHKAQWKAPLQTRCHFAK
jgi:molecular chaperone DnaK (HSP70)